MWPMRKAREYAIIISTYIHENEVKNMLFHYVAYRFAYRLSCTGLPFNEAMRSDFLPFP